MKQGKFGRLITGIAGSERRTNKFAKGGGVYTSDEVFSIKTEEAGIYTGSTVVTKTVPDGWPRANVDPYYPSNLCHFDAFGPYGHMFKDYSGNHLDDFIYNLGQNQIPAVTRFSPIYTDWSSLFLWDGYYQVNDQVNLRLGTGNFTIEFWMKSTAQRYQNQFILSKGNNAFVQLGLGWSVYLNSNEEIVFFDAQASSQAAANIVTTGANITRDTWTHVALQRQGTGSNQFQIFINGIPKANGTLASNYTDSSNMYIARDRTATQQLNSIQQSYAGNLTDIRIRNDAVYPGSVGTTFTPPTGPLDMANTSTVFALPTWARNHLNNYAQHPTGSTVKAFNKVHKVDDSPFKNTTHATGHGAYSMYSYDGGRRYYYGDSNTAFTGHHLFTGNFTIEGWYYGIPGGNMCLVSKGSGSNGWALWAATDQSIRFDQFGGSNNVGTNTESLAQYGAWNHIAAVRSTYGASGLGIYLNGQKVFTGACQSSFLDSMPIIINGTRDSSQVGQGYLCGVRISNTDRYSANFNVNSSSFVTQTCTPDGSTVFLTATSDAFKPFQMEPIPSVFGQLRQAGLQYGGNDIRLGNRSWNYRGRTPSWTGWDVGTTRIIANTVNGDFNFAATQDFSIEIWCQISNDKNNNLQEYTLWDGRMRWSNNSIWCRWTGDSKNVEVSCNGRVILTGHSAMITDGGSWNHVCVQRVNTAIALYVNGRKEDEIIYVQAIAATNNRITIGQQSYNKLNYGTNWPGHLTDFRIVKGSAAYAVANSNPEFIPVPRQPLSNIANTVLLTLNREPIGDYSGRNNMVAIGGEANVANSDGYLTSSWSMYSGATSPYSPDEWDYTVLNTDGCSRDDVIYYIRGIRDATENYNAGGGAPELSFMSRWIKPWTIEIVYWAKQVDPTGGISGPYPESGRPLFRTASSNNNAGFELLYHWSGTTNGLGYSGWGDQTLRFWNPQVGSTVNNFTYSTFSNTGIQNTFKGHSLNNLTVVYDPSKSVNFAMYLNGRRIVANTGVFSANVNEFILPFNRMQVEMTSEQPKFSNLYGLRVSDNARYDTTSTTIPLLSSSTYVEDANTQVIYGRNSVINDKTQCVFIPYFVFPNYTYKKYGDFSLRFENRFVSNFSSYIRVDSNSNYYSPRNNQIRLGDYTLEMWASWLAPNSGGISFAYTTNANNRHCLFHVQNYLYVGATDAGLWRLGYMNATGDPSGNWTTDMIPFHQVNTSVSVAQCWTGNPNAFDHICIVRKNMVTAFYINGVEQGRMIDHNTQNWGGANTQVSSQGGPQDTYYADLYSADGSQFMTLGTNWNSDQNYAWNGFIQDFRWSQMARYKTKVINGVSTMVFADTNIPALPTLAAGPLPTR